MLCFLQCSFNCLIVILFNDDVDNTEGPLPLGGHIADIDDVVDVIDVFWFIFL